MLQNIIEIDCGKKFTINHVSDIYLQLLTAMAEQQAVSIDISQIERIDTAAMQLLYNFERDAEKQDLVVMWSKASQVFEQAADTLAMPPFYRHGFE